MECRKNKALQTLSQTEGLEPEGLQKVIVHYLFTERKPLRNDIVAIMHKRPGLKECKVVTERNISKIEGFVEMFIAGVD